MDHMDRGRRKIIERVFKTTFLKDQQLQIANYPTS